ncbi:glycosyltransferase family 2 protein [Bacteroides sp.]|uniref:glycosyltransferase family 2 protein n=1 Tax=Bacteroides sp. TaxID=29523 RepID=UPI003AB4F48C
MKILVIIVSYNFERWIDRCLGSLRQSEQQADVVVVDNASQDRTVQLIKEHYPEVRLIRSKENLGFGRANNIGMKIALEEGYDAVFLLNQDAWIDAKVLGTLSKLSLKHPRYGILSPVHLTGSGDKLEQGFAGYAGLDNLEEVKREENRQGMEEQQELVTLPFINAAFWMIPTSVLREVGGFCPLFYHYGEDVDYVNRLHHHGYSVGYSPAVFGCHDREHRKVSREAWLRSEQIYLLTEYANINYPFPKAFGFSVLAGIKKSWKALIKKDARTSAAYIGITFRLLGRTRKVLHYRKTNLHSKKSSLYLTD